METQPPKPARRSERKRDVPRSPSSRVKADSSRLAKAGEKQRQLSNPGPSSAHLPGIETRPIPLAGLRQVRDVQERSRAAIVRAGLTVLGLVILAALVLVPTEQHFGLDPTPTRLLVGTILWILTSLTLGAALGTEAVFRLLSGRRE